MAIPARQGAAQYAQQFLSTVLSQRGPSALPYAEDVKWLIRQHLVQLIETYPSLHAKTAVYTHNDGTSVNLLQAEGTLPIVYNGVVYNLPIVFWLTEPYPRHPPSVYLTPTHSMVIKRPHPHVNPSGLVSVPYLLSWVFPSSNLLDLARSLSSLFALDPPLHSRSPASPSPSPSPPVSFNSNPNSNPSSRSSSTTSSSSSADVFRRNAVDKLVSSLHADTAEMQKGREAEMEGTFAAQAELRRRGEQIARGVGELQQDKEALEQQLQLVLMNSDVLEAWVRDNEAKGRCPGLVDADEAFEPCDGLSRQMMECAAADLAIEDVVYSLDKAVQEGAIPVDMYLKNVRALSREQFFHRAMAVKVRGAQMQAQVAGMAARAGKYAV